LLLVAVGAVAALAGCGGASGGVGGGSFFWVFDAEAGSYAAGDHQEGGDEDS
jgi:hypothetical protein